MTAPSAPDALPPAGTGSAWTSPFAIFGYAMVLASGYAVFEMAYYAGVPALSGATFGTIAGILAAIAVFLVLGVRAPPNE
ncbi:MAG: hypothetical protein QXG65_01860 [Thermoplasmata archaeon]